MEPNAPRTVLITGASSGIGHATAQRLAASGFKLFLTGRSAEKLAALSGAIEDAPWRAVDLATPHAAESLFEEAGASLGRIDAVVHCAGVGLIKPAIETTDAEFSRILNINTRVTFLVATEAIRRMIPHGGGRIITLPGILGKAVMKNAAAYIASKYAVTGLVKALNLEYQRQGIQCCLLHLGGVDSPFWDSLNMKVQRDKMIPVDTAARFIEEILQLPDHLVLGELTLQPDSHQL